MKKKALVFIATLALLLAGSTAYISAQHVIICTDDSEGGGGSYIPESCTSSISCMPNYSDRKMPYSGNIYCCSENTPGVTGKTKA